MTRAASRPATQRHGMGFDSKPYRPFPRHQVDDTPLLLGSVWVAGLSLVLSLVPMAGGFAGGMLGGWLVGSPRRGIYAALIGAVVYALLFRFIPYAGIFRGTPTDATATILLAAAAMLVGAIAGGAVAKSRGTGQPV